MMKQGPVRAGRTGLFILWISDPVKAFDEIVMWITDLFLWINELILLINKLFQSLNKLIL